MRYQEFNNELDNYNISNKNNDIGIMPKDIKYKRISFASTESLEQDISNVCQIMRVNRSHFIRTLVLDFLRWHQMK